MIGELLIKLTDDCCSVEPICPGTCVVHQRGVICLSVVREMEIGILKCVFKSFHCRVVTQLCTVSRYGLTKSLPCLIHKEHLVVIFDCHGVSGM